MLNSVLKLNNAACCLIKRGLHDEAIDKLMIALKETKRIALQQSSSTADGDTPESSIADPADNPEQSVPSTECCPCSSCHEHPLESHSEAEYADLCRAHASDCVHGDGSDDFDTPDCPSGAFMYREPVFITSALTQDSCPTLSQLTFYIMFNLALIHQLKAMMADSCIEWEEKVRDDKARSLLISRRLYEISFQAQKDSSECNVFLMTALLNNLSLVHKMLGSERKSQQCQEMLLSALVVLVDEWHIASQYGFVDTSTNLMDDCQHHLDGLWGNVMHLIVCASPVASAA